MRIRRYVVAAGAVGLVAAGVVVADGFQSGIKWAEPPVVTPGATPTDPPSDAVVLFDGKDLSQWKNGGNWEIKDGAAIGRKSQISTKEKFGTCQLHVEFATPEKVTGSGQGRGNNGVLLMDRYEIQVLDSYDNKTYFDGQCGSVYKQSPPMVNVCRKPGEWQTYDIVFEAPQFAADGKLERPAYVTVFQNGVLIQNHFELSGNTFFDKAPAYKKHGEKEPLTLFYHGNEVKFRNIWVREFKPAAKTG